MIARAAVLAALLAGCYDPDLRDCAVTCRAQTDCAGDQTCGSDGYCIGPGATACSPDDEPDARPAPTMVTLHVTIDGKGSVMLDSMPLLTCGLAGASEDCTWQIETETVHHLVATPEPTRTFAMWTGDCVGSTTTCTMTPTAAATVGAKFNN